MVGEDLAYFSNEDGPRDTTEIAHTIGTDSSIFGPDLDDSECLLEILCLFAGELDDHQVIFPTNKGSPALLILDSVEEIQRNNFFDISRDCFGLQLAETDIDLNLFVLEGYDGHLGVDSGCKTFDLRLSEQSVCELIEEVSFSLYEVGANTDQINITTV